VGALFSCRSVTESCSAAKDVLAWMSTEVVQNRRSRSAMIVTEGSQQEDMGYAGFMARRFMIGPTGKGGPRNKKASVENQVSCSPPLGSRIFW
jgi:chaperone BCS1